MARAAGKAWSWLVPEPWSPIICSIVGGIFLEEPSGNVRWLDTGTGLVEQIAGSRGDFEQTCRTASNLVDEWFLPPLVGRLHAVGKKPREGECFGFKILPVFVEGKYDTENMIVLPVKEQFIGMAEVHRQLNDLPDGASVQVRVTD
jgi:hypothetical protein